jgi:hypothetical protein
MDGVKFENYLQVFKELGGHHNCLKKKNLNHIHFNSGFIMG